MNEEAIRPCRFCKGPGTAHQRTEANNEVSWAVTCDNCKSSLHPGAATRAEAIAAWNNSPLRTGGAA
jgi:hypothetical protein